MDELNGRKLELERWKGLPSRLAACLALTGFSIAVVCGMVAANEPLTIVFRAMLAKKMWRPAIVPKVTRKVA